MKKTLTSLALVLALCLPCFASYTRAISVSGFDAGLSTVGYTARDMTAGTNGSRVTAGVTEFPAGSGNYTATFTGADNHDYTIVWDNGAATPLYSSSISLTDLQPRGVAVTLPLTAPTGYGDSGADTPGTTLLLGRLTPTRAGYLDNLSVAPPTASQNATALLNSSVESGSVPINVLAALRTVLAYVGGNTDTTGNLFKAGGDATKTRITYTINPTTKARTITLSPTP